MANLLAELTVLLQEDLQNINHLNHCLAEEKELLSKRDYKSLPDLAKKKHSFSQSIELNNQKKRSMIAPISINDKGQDLFKALVIEFGQAEAEKLKALNHQLEQELDKCRKQNAINGQVIVRSLENNQQLVDIVMGKAPREEFYNALGQSSSQSSAKSYSQKV